MKKLTVLALSLLTSTTAFAADHKPSSGNMELYPKSRASYQSRFDERAEAYEINKRAYIDNMYENRGESGSSTSGEPLLPEADLDAYLNGTAKLEDGKKTATPTKAPPLPSGTK